MEVVRDFITTSRVRLEFRFCVKWRDEWLFNGRTGCRRGGGLPTWSWPWGRSWRKCRRVRRVPWSIHRRWPQPRTCRHGELGSAGLHREVRHPGWSSAARRWPQPPGRPEKPTEQSAQSSNQLKCTQEKLMDLCFTILMEAMTMMGLLLNVEKVRMVQTKRWASFLYAAHGRPRFCSRREKTYISLSLSPGPAVVEHLLAEEPR